MDTLDQANHSRLSYFLSKRLPMWIWQSDFNEILHSMTISLACVKSVLIYLFVKFWLRPCHVVVLPNEKLRNSDSAESNLNLKFYFQLVLDNVLVNSQNIRLQIYYSWCIAEFRESQWKLLIFWKSLFG